jgi:hypothetical protein
METGIINASPLTRMAFEHKARSSIQRKEIAYEAFE